MIHTLVTLAHSELPAPLLLAVKFKPFSLTLSFNLFPLTFFFIFVPLSTVDKFVLIATTEKNAKTVSPVAFQQSVPAIVKHYKLTYELSIYF